MSSRDFILLFLILVVVSALSGCSPTFRYVCPSLSAPPGSIVDALETAGRKDPASAAWVIDLDKHYRKCDSLASGATR